MMSERPIPGNVWASGEAYEPYVGRWSRLVAREFLAWLSVPAGKRGLDVGCGTGALTETILTAAQPSYVKGIDPSAEFIAFASERVHDERVRFEVGGAQALSDVASSYDAVAAGLVLNFVPKPEEALAE